VLKCLCLSVYVFMFMRVCLYVSVPVSVSVSVYVSVFMYMCLGVSVFVSGCLCLCFCFCVCVNVCVSVSLTIVFICLSLCACDCVFLYMLCYCRKFLLPRKKFRKTKSLSSTNLRSLMPMKVQEAEKMTLWVLSIVKWQLPIFTSTTLTGQCSFSVHSSRFLRSPVLNSCPRLQKCTSQLAWDVKM
jgi:hypothetical protein